jgi:hypothetical protein
LRARYRDWCLAFAERAGAGLEGAEQFAYLRLLTVEHDNIRAVVDACALDTSLSETELRLVAAMARFWFSRQPDEGRRRSAAAVERNFVRLPPIGAPCIGGRSYVRARQVATVVNQLGRTL